MVIYVCFPASSSDRFQSPISQSKFCVGFGASTLVVVFFSLQEKIHINARKDRCFMDDVGCWIIDVGCWILDVGFWMLDV
jgi:hypothetical protein